MAWGRRKSGPNSAKKPVFLPVSAHLFFLSLSIVVFSHHHPHHQSSHHHHHHRKPTQSPADHQEPPSVSLSSLQPLPRVFVSLICFLCRRPPSLSQPQPPSSRQPLTVSTTNRPPSSHRDSLPLLLPAFLSPLQPFLLPPVADTDLHRYNHRQHTVILGQTTTTPGCPPSLPFPFFTVPVAWT